CSTWMFCAEHLFPNGKTALGERLRRRKFGLISQNAGDVDEAGGRVRMLRPELLFADCQRPLKHRPYLTEICTLGLKTAGKIVERGGRVSMARTEGLLSNFQSALILHSRAAKVPLIAKQTGQMVQAGSRERGLGTERAFSNGEGALVKRACRC